ncbi:TPA: hypothetical protein RKX70_004198 [Escherichia coli]|uniref:hypothetical protein n=1 Tax=Klebsiella pneumoniae TaxID=573 RepID=UPI0017C50571|nr:hypothetical protein [Salmonella enterica]EFG2528804.1 hypothetical protein [Escherichia coli]HDW0064511.1 hypothetical protein [Escherichia coli]
MKQTLSTTEHNQARANLLTLRTILESYISSHPKKHGWQTAILLAIPAVGILPIGAGMMTDIGPLVGAAFTLITSVILYGGLGYAGFFKPVWNDDEINMRDMKKIREFAPFVKDIVSQSMERNDGKLTYTQLESVLSEAEEALKEDELRFNISKQLSEGL